MTTTLLVAAVLPASAAAQSLPDRTLERGDRGSDVRTVQRALSKVRVRTASDGVFGRGTERSVRRYERRVGIRVDGEVSRGQARGLLKRAGIPVTAMPESEPGSGSGQAEPRSATTTTGGAFPIQGEWRFGGEGAGFGDRGGAHKGVDVFADCGVPLIAPEAGEVVFVGNHSRAGHYVVVRSAQSGEDQVFMHLQSATPVEKGADVAAGASLGAVGDSGNATACHLHFEIWTAPGWYEGGKARDPRPDLDRWAAADAS